MEVEVEEERRRREGERGGLNLFYVWTYCAIYDWPDLSNICLDKSVQYNIGHIWPIGQIWPMEAINYNFPDNWVMIMTQLDKISKKFHAILELWWDFYHSFTKQ